MNTQIVNSRNELDFHTEQTLSENLADDMWSPNMTIRAAGCLHNTIEVARQELADFWAQDTDEGESVDSSDIEELAEFLSGVKMGGNRVHCSVESAAGIAEDYLGLEIIN